MRSNVSYRDLSLISGNIAKLYEEGISIINILVLLDELPLRKDYKSFLNNVKLEIENGSSLEEAFSSNNKLFPQFFVSMISIGESTGKTIYVLKGLEIYYSKLQYIKKLFISALTYPVILLLSLFCLGIFVLLFFIPNMAGIYESMGKEIPARFINIVNFKKSIISNPLVTIVKIVVWGGIIPYMIISKYLKKYIVELFCKLNIYNQINEYIAIVLISVIVNSGINISLGLSYCCEEKLSSRINESLIKINKNIIKGKGLSQSMSETSLFSKYTLAHIKLGEESGTLDNRLMLLEKEQFETITNNINKKMQFIQPILILFIGGLIAAFIIVFIMPLLDSLMIR